MSVAANSSFAPPYRVELSDISAAHRSRCPACSGNGGRYLANFCDRPFFRIPPSAAYASVHYCHGQCNNTLNPS
jgi:hypothetical protein